MHPAPPQLYTLSLHDALPIFARDRNPGGAVDGRAQVGAVVARLEQVEADRAAGIRGGDRKSTRLNSSHRTISYAVFCLKKKNTTRDDGQEQAAHDAC